MIGSINFPEAAKSALDRSQVGSVSGLEDRIEQKYKLMDIVQSINVINGLAGPNKPEMTPGQLDAMAELDELIKKEGDEFKYSPKNQVQKDRDLIHEILLRNGMATTLMFLSPSLFHNIEIFFSGIVIKYIGLFDSGGVRSALDYKHVFKGEDELRKIHENFYDLRREWYAHNGRHDGRHTLRYVISEAGEVLIDDGSPQSTPEYHSSEFKNLYKCAYQALSFVENDIIVKSGKFISSLTDKQKSILIKNFRSGE